MARPRNKGEQICVWVEPSMAADLQRISKRRTSGNRSQAIRYLLAQAVKAEAQDEHLWVLGTGGYE